MRPVRIFVLGAALVLGATAVAGCSSSKSSKSDTTKKTDSGVTATTAGNGTPVAVVVSDTKGIDAPETMTATPASVPAGPVTFTVENTGTIKHELVVLKTDGVPLTATKGKVSEKASAGEVEVEEGKTESVTLDLEAGQYELVCNIKEHYELGMHVPFTVT